MGNTLNIIWYCTGVSLGGVKGAEAPGLISKALGLRMEGKKKTFTHIRILLILERNTYIYRIKGG